MNIEILNQYNLVMRKTTIPFDGFVSGPLEGYIYIFRHPEDVQEFIDAINLAIAGQFNEIEDPDWSSGLTRDYYWHANITPSHFEIRYNSIPYEERQIIPLDDWREILLSWKECLE